MTAPAVLVCVTGQRLCERLISRGSEIAEEQGADVLVLSVVGSGQNNLAIPEVASALDYLYGASAHSGAEMTVLCSSKPLDTIVDFARSHGVRHLVIGEGRMDAPGGGFAARLSAALPSVAFHTVPPC